MEECCKPDSKINIKVVQVLMGHASSSTTAWAVLFTDETLKRRGFHKFSSITLVGTLTAVMHLFSFTDCHKWKQIRILHFTFFVHCAQVVLSHCTIRSAVCAGSQSNNPRFVTALLSAHFYSHYLCEGLCISRLFLLSYFGPLRESGIWLIAGNHKTEQRNRLHLASLFTIYHPVRCQNCDSSLVPHFHFFGPTDNQP